jgi:hypothetical protein
MRATPSAPLPGAGDVLLAAARGTWHNFRAMAFFHTLKDAALGQAMKFASSPRVTKLVSDPRLMNAAMKAMSLGGAMKANFDKATRMAAGAFGIATQDEVASLRTTIQTLEDQVAALESRSSATSAAAAAMPAHKPSV